MPETTYENPWYRPEQMGSSPVFTTDVKPTEYMGFLIYKRIRSVTRGGSCYDVVKDGICFAQMCGINGAHMAIKTQRWKQRDWWKKRFGNAA